MKGTAVKRTNEQWLQDLQAHGEVHTSAIEDLRLILLNGLKRGLLGQVDTSAPGFDELAEDFVQEALIKILDKLETFAGRSQFTTWAHKITVYVALTELRRKRWQDTSLTALTETDDGSDYTPAIISDPTPQPDNVIERNDMLKRVELLIKESLTDKQRTALIASVIQGLSTNEVASRMKMKPNAVYKLLHDARVRLKRTLSEQGLSTRDVMSVFQ